MKSNSTATAWLTLMAIIGLLHGVQGGVLFSDTFDRADNTNLNAATTGKSGTLGALTWTKRGFGTSPTCEIKGQKLAMISGSSTGSHGNIAYLGDHNFIDTEILLAGNFTVSVDIASMSSGGNNRNMGFGVGQSLAELATTQAGADKGRALSDFYCSYDSIGTGLGIEIYHGATKVAGFLGTVDGSDTISATFTLTSFSAGSSVSYAVYLNGSPIHNSSFAWSGTNENYIHLQSNATNLSSFENFSLSVDAPPTVFWDGVSGGWDTVANWSTSSGASTPNPAAVPSLADTAVFNISAANAPQTVALNGDQSARGLFFLSSGLTTITGGDAKHRLTLGGDGIRMQPGSGGLEIGSNQTNQKVAVMLDQGADMVERQLLVVARRGHAGR